MSTEFTENGVPVPQTETAPEASAEGVNAIKPHFASVDKLRFVLMFFVCVKLIGFPTPFGGLVQILSGFATVAFFIISGYLVLRDDADRSKRIRRAIGRSAIAFAVMTAAYFIINFFIYRAAGTNIFLSFRSPRIWFNFLVLNIWPYEFGDAVWFVQALLYAYIGIFILDKLRLLRFDYLFIAVCLLLAVCSSELAGVLHFNILGYTYLPGSFLSRALPYILLGGLIARKRSVFFMVQKWKYVLLAIAGVVLMLGEIYLLGHFNKAGYYGHLIGMPMLAVPICVYAFCNPDSGFRSPFMRGMHRAQINAFYYLCQPVSFVIALGLAAIREGLLTYLSGFVGIMTYAVCFVIVLLLRMARSDD